MSAEFERRLATTALHPLLLISIR